MKSFLPRLVLFLAVFFIHSVATPAHSADEEDTQAQIAKMLLTRARSDYEIVTKAKAANYGLLKKIEQRLQPFLDRKGGEIIYNFRRSAGGSTQPDVREIQELADWHEKAVRRHFYYAEVSIKTGVKLNDALNRMEELQPAAEPFSQDDDEHEELEEE